MDQYEEDYEEVSNLEVAVPEVTIAALPEVAVAAPNVEVPEIPDNPESPPPLPPSPSPELPSPPASPFRDLPSFMGFCSVDDFTELEEWAVDSRVTRSQPESRVEEPEISRKLKVFLRVMLGTQWELKLLRQPGEVLFYRLGPAWVATIN